MADHTDSQPETRRQARTTRSGGNTLLAFVLGMLVIVVAGGAFVAFGDETLWTTGGDIGASVGGGTEAGQALGEAAHALEALDTGN
ncbi:hypothetical protein [Salipiger mucosus]|uniref:Uncharacterized protein n=1 Tax=Salipiger mucosus DSM 16094 TaxID=1123237 RepID=S9S5E9_9RHOB|nr:hypothetical protein [Salipiger mucosus]EPX81424.1 hypothetical protein Salmuc_05090 [Salipiger mucosus DSM 16094]